MFISRVSRSSIGLLAAVWLAAAPVAAQAPQPPAPQPAAGSGQEPPQQPPPGMVPPTKMRPRQPPPKGPDEVKKVGDGVFIIGQVRVNTNTKEVSIPGRVNDVTVLEFLANTRNGFKSYESAIELFSNAINFNVALLLIGLDADQAVVSPRDRQPEPPKGQTVEVVVRIAGPGGMRAVPAEELIMNMKTKETLPKAPWVYTGSTIVPKGNVLMADLDGVMIGFMHTRASVIDYGGTLDANYGSYRLNTDLVKPGTAVEVVVRAAGLKVTPGAPQED